MADKPTQDRGWEERLRDAAEKMGETLGEWLDLLLPQPQPIPVPIRPSQPQPRRR